MSSIAGHHSAVDSEHQDRLVGSQIRAIRQSLGVTTTELANASGIPLSGIAAIERGHGATRAERYDIAMAVGWLSNNCVAKGLTTQSRL